ncbi:MAG: 4'-phosphopantetheinyl transferase superfamily protein [Verrucomicrobia bacterium]|nr:4'-phosphopantetheinyl transferase superfamily protein [Verrucomicrobiota bacterium]
MESLFDLNWTAPADFTPLKPGESHIWATSIDQPLSVYFELKSFLSLDEQVKAARFRTSQSRQQFVLGRGLLRKLLGYYLDEHPSELSFVYGEHGKPILFNPIGGSIRFNVSHTGELVLLAFSFADEIGVDVEQVRSVPEADVIAERFFSREEVAELANAGAEKRDVFFKIWTCKEALLKCSGVGFGGNTSPCKDLTVHELRPAPGYMAAVAVASPETHFQTMRWSHEIFSPRAGVMML